MKKEKAGLYIRVSTEMQIDRDSLNALISGYTK